MSVTYNFELHHVKRKNGELPIHLRITESRKLKRIKTGIVVVNKNHFNPNGTRGKWIRKSDLEHRIKNEKLLQILKRYEEAQDFLDQSGTQPSVTSVANQASRENTLSLFDFADHHYNNLILKDQLNYAKHFKSVFKKLKTYINEKLKLNDLLFTEVTVGFLSDYEAYLSSLGNNQNTIAKNLKIIRAVINQAISQDLMQFDQNPFLRFKIKRENTEKVALNQEEIKKIETAKLDKWSRIWHVRNYFLFSFYCAGIRVGDIIQLKWKNINDGKLTYTMSKNNKKVSLKLPPKAEKILMYYKKNKINPEHYVFPLLNNNIKYTEKQHLMNQISSKNTIINKNLKDLAKAVGISKPISFHIARHSFSDISRKKGADIYSISKALNHSSINITEAYLASFDQGSVDDLLLKL